MPLGKYGIGLTFFRVFVLESGRCKESVDKRSSADEGRYVTLCETYRDSQHTVVSHLRAVHLAHGTIGSEQPYAQNPYSPRFDFGLLKVAVG